MTELDLSASIRSVSYDSIHSLQVSVVILIDVITLEVWLPAHRREFSSATATANLARAVHRGLTCTHHIQLKAAGLTSLLCLYNEWLCFICCKELHNSA